jgi:hypothetical protein
MMKSFFPQMIPQPGPTKAPYPHWWAEVMTSSVENLFQMAVLRARRGYVYFVLTVKETP